MKSGWKSLAGLSMLFAVLYTFCLYENASGITMPLFAFGFVLLCRKSLVVFGKRLKKSSIYYEIPILGIGIVTFLTADSRIIVMNHLFFLLAAISYLLHLYKEDEKWEIPHFVLQVFELVFGSIGKVFAPFSDFNKMLQDKDEMKEKKHKIQFVAVGMLVSIPMIAIVLVLLMQADIVFGTIVTSLLGKVTIPEHVMGIAMMTVFGFFLFYCVHIYLNLSKQTQEDKKEKTGEPLIAITFTSMLGLIYLLFSLIQVFYLFMGFGTLPDGYSYAQYAREGFFQLVAVCILNLILVLVCFYYFRENKVLRLSLSVISGSTYIMIFSSAYKMILYIQEYQLTFLRVFVLWDLALIFLAMTGIVIAIYKKSFPLLKYGMICFAMWYLSFSLSRPDSYIADYNIAQSAKQEQDMDLSYVFSLSADAMNSIAKERNRMLQTKEQDQESKMFLEASENYMDKISRETENMGMREFNLSYYLAGRWTD